MVGSKPTKMQEDSMQPIIVQWNAEPTVAPGTRRSWNRRRAEGQSGRKTIDLCQTCLTVRDCAQLAILPVR